MAECSRNQLPSGYHECFVNAIDGELHCLICHLTLKDPVQTRCGHRFCQECLQEYFRRQRIQDQPLTCPADRESLDEDRDVFRDKATERKILSLIIKCSSDSCDWTGELRNKEIHLASCVFKPVFCTNENCQMIFQRKDLVEHVTITCKWRILECDHCSEPHPECSMKDHIVQCRRYPVTCPNSCGVLVPREMIPNHTEDDCPLTIISCPYARMGCITKIQRRQAESHLQSATSLHLDLACVKLHDTEIKLNDTQEVTSKLTEKLDTLQRRLEDKLLEDETNSTDREEKIVMMKSETRDSVLVFVWKINNFSEILRQAKTEEVQRIESAAFYTENYGYKLKLSINPNGSGSGKNTHLSVFIHVMKGEYDAILPWPFKRKVRFTLIDQQEDPDERENVTFHFTPDNSSNNYARPTKEQNKRHGVLKLITHEKLNTRRYIANNTLFLQVKVYY